MNYSIHIRKIRYKILEFSEVACYTFRRLQVRELSGIALLTSTINQWYSGWVKRMGGQAEMEGLRLFMDSVNRVIKLNLPN